MVITNWKYTEPPAWQALKLPGASNLIPAGPWVCGGSYCTPVSHFNLPNNHHSVLLFQCPPPRNETHMWHITARIESEITPVSNHTWNVQLWLKLTGYGAKFGWMEQSSMQHGSLGRPMWRSCGRGGGGGSVASEEDERQCEGRRGPRVALHCSGWVTVARRALRTR